MSLIAQLLNEGEQLGPTHPLIRTWGWQLEHRQGEARCRIDRRRQGLTYLPTKLYLQLVLNSGEPRTESSEWDAELNRWLIQQKVKAVDEANEAIRFQLVLRDLLQKTEIRLGEGYFDAMLIDVLTKTGLAGDPRITFILSKVGNSSPHIGAGYQAAFETIKAALSDCARSLKHLGYAEDAVLNILVGAIEGYLADRFSVTNRAILGLD